MHVKTDSNRLDSMIRRYADFVLRWRWPVILSCLLGTGLLASQLGGLSLNTQYRVFFGEDNPQLLAFDELQNTYTKNDSTLIALETRNTVFTPEVIKAIGELTERAKLLPYSLRVDSLTNFQWTRADGDDLLVTDLFPDPANVTEAEIANAMEVALHEPLLVGRLLSVDALHTGVLITYEFPQKSLTEVPEAGAADAALADEVAAAYDSISNVYLTGGVHINNAFTNASQQDFMTLIPAMYLLILLLTGILLRSLAGVIGAFLVVTFSTLAALGTGGLLGVELTPIATQIPILIMTLAVADTIHVVFTAYEQRREGKSTHAAVHESLRLNFGAIFVTSATTAIGFLTLNFADSPPFHTVGNITAIGVLFAWVFSVTLLPALLSLFTLRPPPQTSWLHGRMTRLADLIINKQKLVLIGMSLLTMMALLPLPLVHSNDRFTEFFAERVRFTGDNRHINDNLSGTYYISYSLPAGEPNGITEPAYLRKLEAFEKWWWQQPETRHVNSFTEVMKRLNRSMHGGDEAWYKLPDNRELAAQYLLLYELSLPFGLDLNNQVDIDKSATRFDVTTDDMDSTDVRRLAAASEAWLETNLPELATKGVSPPVMFSYISERGFNSMIDGSIIALVGISLLLILALRSVKIGLLSLIPNVAPLAIAFGIWGLFVGEVNFNMAIVLGMTLGIIVDDSVHFLSKYLRARRENGLDAPDAVRYAFTHVGGALLIMTSVLLAGFVLLTFSAYYGNSTMAALTSIAIAAALITDFLLLPALLLQLDRKPTNNATTPKELAHEPAST